ncbi:MAG TPA: hypothetical protein VJ250_04375 [Nitrososphaeraceae archaeon]|nr:hypothetical protein [Nitrososphaeraceae archaeon]
MPCAVLSDRNEKNEFNKIYNLLPEIESIIDDMKKFIKILFALLPEEAQAEDVKKSFMPNLAHMLNEILLDSLVKADNITYSEIDRQILYKKIIKLMLELTKMSKNLIGTPSKPNLIFDLDLVKNEINHFSKEIPQSKRKHWKKHVEAMSNLIGPMTNLIKKADKIKKES